MEPGGEVSEGQPVLLLWAQLALPREPRLS